LIAVETLAPPGFTLVAYEARHYLEASRDLYALWPRDAIARPETVAETYALGGPAYALLSDRTGEVAAVAGVMCLWRGLGHAWAIVTDHVRHREDALPFHYMIRRILRQLEAEYQWRCILAFVMRSDHRAQRWTAALGFEPRCDLPHYGPGGETFRLWARYPMGRDA
jgi:hypothetical protein